MAISAPEDNDSIRFDLMTAFSQKPLGGNPAAIVYLTPKEFIAIAENLNNLSPPLSLYLPITTPKIPLSKFAGSRRLGT
jgi:hypothetical protein